MFQMLRDFDCFQKFMQFSIFVELCEMVHQSRGTPEGRLKVVFTGLDPEGSRLVGLTGLHVTVQRQVLPGDNKKHTEDLRLNEI